MEHNGKEKKEPQRAKTGVIEENRKKDALRRHPRGLPTAAGL